MLNILKIFENIVQRNEKEPLNLSSGTIRIEKSIYYQNSVRIHVTTFQGKLQSFWYLNQLKLLFILLDFFFKKKEKWLRSRIWPIHDWIRADGNWGMECFIVFLVSFTSIQFSWLKEIGVMSELTFCPFLLKSLRRLREIILHVYKYLNDFEIHGWVGF